MTQPEQLLFFLNRERGVDVGHIETPEGGQSDESVYSE